MGEKSDTLTIIACGILTIYGFAINNLIYVIIGIGLLNAFVLAMIYDEVKKRK